MPRVSALLGMAMAAMVCLGSRGVAQESEAWPWGEDGALVGEPVGEPVAEPPPGDAVAAEGAGATTASAAPAEIVGEEQDLSLIEAEFGTPGGKAATRVKSAAPGGAAAGIDVSAFEELLRENMALRRQVDDAQANIEQAAADKRRLEQEMSDLERQVSESVALIQKMKREAGNVPPAAAPVADASAATEELDALRLRHAELQTQFEALQAQVSAAEPTVPVVVASPAAGSDLFRELEAENGGLKRKLAEAESAQQAADTERLALVEQHAAGIIIRDAEVARRTALEAELQQARDEQQKLQQMLEKLLVRVPDLEKELVGLRDTVSAKDREATERARDLEALRLEMDKREQRLIKAEKMASLLERSRAEVKSVSKKEERDLHYNMAAVYSREGRHREAEQAYLKALRADPTDAGSHYNLGILYEDVLADKGKAAMHYRAYLKLAPNADDVDQVKSWLLQLDLQ